MKLAVVGGGSTYTPELLSGLTEGSARLPVDEVVLHDVDPERLQVVGGFGRRMLEAREWTGRLSLTDQLEPALEGASYVLVQLRVGGQPARHLDETIPLRFGAIGQETTGPGGLAKALRTVPVVLDIAEKAARLAAPDHWLIDFTNPVGIVCQALADEGHRALGVCNVAIGFQRRFADRLGVEPDRVALDHAGLNHLTWIREVRVDGVDRLAELLDHHGDWIAADLGLSTDLIRDLGAVPSYYLRYFYDGEAVLAEQQSATRSRAETVMALEHGLLEQYRDPRVTAPPPALAQRGGAFYSEAALQVIRGLHDGSASEQVVNVRNGGALAGLPNDAIVELPADLGPDGARPRPVAPLAPGPLGLAQEVKAYERLAVRAARTGELRDVRLALLANPLVSGWPAAAGLAEALLEANAPWLPARRGG